jgi:polygalacturonase
MKTVRIMKRLIFTFFAFISIVAEALSEKSERRDFNILSYGGSVSKAAEEAAKNGGGRIVVPKGVWRSGTIWLKDHCELHLEKGAVILGSTNQKDYNANDVSRRTSIA